jgi:hypothetical protein
MNYTHDTSSHCVPSFIERVHIPVNDVIIVNSLSHQCTTDKQQNCKYDAGDHILKKLKINTLNKKQSKTTINRQNISLVHTKVLVSPEWGGERRGDKDLHKKDLQRRLGSGNKHWCKTLTLLLGIRNGLCCFRFYLFALLTAKFQLTCVTFSVRLKKKNTNKAMTMSHPITVTAMKNDTLLL